MALFSDLEKTTVMIEFTITGDEFNPEMITKELSLVPKRTWKKGDKVKNGEHLWKYSCWMLSTGYIESFGINVQLQKIIGVLSTKKKELIKIKKELDVDYKMTGVINIRNYETPAIILNSDVIAFMHEIGAEFDIDMYVNEMSDEESPKSWGNLKSETTYGMAFTDQGSHDKDSLIKTTEKLDFDDIEPVGISTKRRRDENDTN